MTYHVQWTGWLLFVSVQSRRRTPTRSRSWVCCCQAVFDLTPRLWGAIPPCKFLPKMYFLTFFTIICSLVLPCVAIFILFFIFCYSVKPVNGLQPKPLPLPELQCLVWYNRFFSFFFYFSSFFYTTFFLFIQQGKQWQTSDHHHTTSRSNCFPECLELFCFLDYLEYFFFFWKICKNSMFFF